MEITDERLREYQYAYAKDFGEEISLPDAREQLSRLVTLYELILRPFPEKKKGQNAGPGATLPSVPPLRITDVVA
jgi:hypothetical protein